TKRRKTRAVVVWRVETRRFPGLVLCSHACCLPGFDGEGLLKTPCRRKELFIRVPIAVEGVRPTVFFEFVRRMSK
ncbi:MAG: hypothetical protein FWD46_08935, partial [Cystobacterineae bacterium]|nr:hypothetical protein [Cystobacterineae bacterium]